MLRQKGKKNRITEANLIKLLHLSLVYAPDGEVMALDNLRRVTRPFSDLVKRLLFSLTAIHVMPVLQSVLKRIIEKFRSCFLSH